MLAAWLAALLVVSSTPAAAVDRAKFRACKDSPFCGLHRGLRAKPDAERTLYAASSPQLEGELGGDTTPLAYSVEAFDNGIVHLRIRESSPLVPRFEAADAVVQPGKRTVVQPACNSKASGTLSCGTPATQFELTASPFSLRVGGESASVHINADQLLMFQQTREKGESENREEQFGSFRDARPHGAQSVGVDVLFQGAQHVYGIPEHATQLSLKNTWDASKDEALTDPYRLFNLDVFEYELDNPMALYGAVPIMVGHGVDSSGAATTMGILWLNAAETWIDVADAAGGKQTHWFSETGVIDIYIATGPTPAAVFAQLTDITGRAPQPQMFAIAYHQCRWNYRDDADVRTVVSQFDANDLPMDVIWLDIEHTDGKRYFTWDRKAFSDPTGLQASVATYGRKMVTIVDPHVKRDGNYYIHKEAESKGLYVKNKDGGDYDGFCWPGQSSYLDFTSAPVREWWAAQFAYDRYEGSTPNLFIWNDMNEPSVFNGPEVSMPRDAIHAGGWEHRAVHNLWGMQLHEATADGLVLRNENKNERPFVLSRAFFAGSQRFGAVWTGDNAAQWSHLAASTPMLLSIGIAGIPFAGADVGGFFGNPSTALLVRWYQAGAFQPFFRGHAHIDANRREPYLFGDAVTAQIRVALRTRYAILPYLYTLFRVASVSGMPVMRPLWVEFPNDASTFAVDSSFMLGPALLVRPIASESETSYVSVQLPGKQGWYDYLSRKFYAPSSSPVSVPVLADSIPVFQRGGTIIARRDRARRSSALMVNDPYTLVVALENQSTASGELYIDDGHTFDYTRGHFVSVEFAFRGSKLSARVVHRDTSGSFQTAAKIERIVISGLPSAPTSVTLDGRSLDVEYEAVSRTATIRKPEVGIASDWTIVVA